MEAVVHDIGNNSSKHAGNGWNGSAMPKPEVASVAGGKDTGASAPALYSRVAHCWLIGLRKFTGKCFANVKAPVDGWLSVQ